MRYAALIVDNRLEKAKDAIARHKPFLPGWEIIHENGKGLAKYNALMTNYRFWLDLERYERVLIFQHDSDLLRHGIEEFLQYDYVGAPFKFQKNGGNGGLSLRNPKAITALLKYTPYKPEHGNEDIFYSNRLQVAPREVCEQFSCETIFKLGTLGCHAIAAHLSPDECNQIYSQYAAV